MNLKNSLYDSLFHLGLTSAEALVLYLLFKKIIKKYLLLDGSKIPLDTVQFLLYMVIVRFDDNGGGMRIHNNRVYKSLEEAERAIGIKRISQTSSFLGPWGYLH